MAVLYRTRALCGEVRHRTMYIFWATFCVLFPFNTYSGSRDTNMEALLSKHYWYYCYCNNTTNASIPDKTDWQQNLWQPNHGVTNLAEWSPPDLSTSRQPSPGGLVAHELRNAQGSLQLLTPGSQPTTVSADYVHTRWRDDGGHHYSAETECQHIFFVSLYSPTNAHNKI